MCRQPRLVATARTVVDDPDHQVEVSGCRRTAALPTLAAQPDPLTIDHARRDGDVKRARAFGAADRQTALGAVVGLFDGHLHLGLVVGARDRAWSPAGPAPDDHRPRAPAPASAYVRAWRQAAGSVSGGTRRKSSPKAS